MKTTNLAVWALVALLIAGASNVVVAKGDVSTPQLFGMDTTQAVVLIAAIIIAALLLVFAYLMLRRRRKRAQASKPS